MRSVPMLKASRSAWFLIVTLTSAVDACPNAPGIEENEIELNRFVYVLTAIKDGRENK